MWYMSEETQWRDLTVNGIRVSVRVREKERKTYTHTLVHTHTEYVSFWKEQTFLLRICGTLYLYDKV